MQRCTVASGRLPIVGVMAPDTVSRPTLVLVDTFKGGTGKTTTALWLARSLAATGEKVLLGGLSPQNDLDVGGGVIPGSYNGVRDVLAIGGGEPFVAEAGENLWYAPAGMSALPGEDPGVGDLYRRLAVERDCRWCVVDGINFLQDVSWWVLDSAEVFIIPTFVEAQPVNAALRTLRAVSQYQVELHRLQMLAVARLLLVAVPPPSQRSAATVELFDALRGEYGDFILAAEVRRTARRSVSEAEMLVGTHLRTALAGPRIEADYKAVAAEVKTLLEAADE